MNKKSKIILLIMAVAFVGTSVAGTAYHWPYSVEPVTVGLDEEWKMGTDIEVGTVKGSLRTIPLLNFEYNGISYTTYDDTGLPVNPVLIEKSALMNAGDGRTFQGFYVKEVSSSLSNDDVVYAVYAIAGGNRIYYSTEELYSNSHYKFTLEQKGDKALVNHHPNTSSLFFIWLIYGIGSVCITFIVVMSYVEHKEDKQKRKQKSKII